MNGLKRVRNRHDDALSQIDWRQFETLLANYYRTQGYRVEHVGTGGRGARFDGGIDLKLRRDDEYLVVQCKHWNACQVPHNGLHELIGIMTDERATGAIFITSGEYTDAAKRAARRLEQLRLIDGDELRRMIGPLPEMPVPAARSPAPFWAGSDDGSAARRQPMMRAREAPVVDEPWTRTIVVLAVLLVFGLVLRSLFGSVASPVRTVVPPPHALVAVTPEHPPPAIAHNAVGDLRPASRTPTTAERREAERQAAEAARIIERSTPEL